MFQGQDMNQDIYNREALDVADNIQWNTKVMCLNWSEVGKQDKNVLFRKNIKNNFFYKQNKIT